MLQRCIVTTDVLESLLHGRGREVLQSKDMGTLSSGPGARYYSAAHQGFCGIVRGNR
jgi:hypothetical protein